MSQQEVIQFMSEQYHYDKETRKIIIKDREYMLHITKSNFQLFEERKEIDTNYVKGIPINEEINIEVIRSFNFKEINNYDTLSECVESLLSNY